MVVLTTLLSVLFGASWKTSLGGMLPAALVALQAYASGQGGPGWYLVALGIAAVGRFAADHVTPAPAPVPPVAP